MCSSLDGEKIKYLIASQREVSEKTEATISYLCKCGHNNFDHLLGLTECLLCNCKKFKENK